MKIISTLIILFHLTHVYGQTPQKLWESYYDGDLTGKDIANSLVVDPSGNIYVTGRCYQTASGGNFTTLKYDANGNEVWVDHYNGTSTNGANRGIKMILDKWNNIYVIGTVSSNQGDIAIVKYNSDGLLWSKSYEPYWFGSAGDFGVDIAADTLGNIYAAGQITSLSGNLDDLYVMKCDANGDKIFEDDYSSASGDDYTGGIAVTPDGNVFALTSSFNFFGTATYDITTIHYLENGAHNWFSNYDGGGSGTDYGTSIKVDPFLNQYICGTSDEGTHNDMVVMKQNQYGTRLWVTTYNGSANGNDTAVCTTTLPNGYVAVTGPSRELLNGNTIAGSTTLLIDSGTVVWKQTFYGSDQKGASPAQMTSDEEGNLYVCGNETLSNGTKNAFIIKYDVNGNQVWTVSFDGGSNLDDKFTSIALYNQTVLVSGQSYSTTSNSNFVTVKYDDLTTAVLTFPAAQQYKPLIYPNPVHAGKRITILNNLPASDSDYTIYTLQGNPVANGKLPEQFLTIPPNFTQGMYVVKISDENATYYHQLLVLTTE